MKKYLTAVVLALVSVSASAYDFEWEGIYYNIVSVEERTCEVTYNNQAPYSGDITIPATAFCNGIPMKVIRIPNYGICGDITSITIEPGLTSIGIEAFTGCKQLTSVTIPSTVTTIGDGAFFGLPQLTSVNIPSSVTSFGLNVFRDCSNLASVEIADGITTIPYKTFSGCKKLSSITIPASVTKIERYAFYDSGITSIDLPDNLEDIGDWTFYRTPLKSITIPRDVSWIREHTFQNCKQLISVKCSHPISVFAEAFEYCESLIELPQVNWVAYQAFQYCTSLKSIDLAESNRGIGSKAFEGCISLSDISIPDNVVGIGEDAFSGCVSLESVDLPKNIETVANRSFQNCVKLSTIKIPSNMPFFGESVFEGCTNLETIFSYSEKPTGIKESTFGGCSEDMIIYIPRGTKSTYLITPGWSRFKNYEEFDIDPSSVSDLKALKGITVQHDNGCLTISGLSEGEQIRIYDTSGILLDSTTAISDTAIVNVHATSRIVILKVGNESIKVRL